MLECLPNAGDAARACTQTIRFTAWSSGTGRTTKQLGSVKLGLKLVSGTMENRAPCPSPARQVKAHPCKAARATPSLRLLRCGGQQPRRQGRYVVPCLGAHHSLTSTDRRQEYLSVTYDLCPNVHCAATTIALGSVLRRASGFGAAGPNGLATPRSSPSVRAGQSGHRLRREAVERRPLSQYLLHRAQTSALQTLMNRTAHLSTVHLPP